MSMEHRLRLSYVGPLGKARSPPFVIFWNRVILGQVEGYESIKFSHAKALSDDGVGVVECLTSTTNDREA